MAAHVQTATPDLALNFASWKRGAGSWKGANHMLYYALVFFVVAVIAAILGFGGVAVAAAGIAKILFFIFLVLFIVSLLGHALRRT